MLKAFLKKADEFCDILYSEHKITNTIVILIRSVFLAKSDPEYVNNQQTTNNYAVFYAQRENA